MRILLNGAWRELSNAELAAGESAAGESAGGEVGCPGLATPTLAAMLQVCGYAHATVATAVNGEFVPARARAHLRLREGDRVEVLAPMQGG